MYLKKFIKNNLITIVYDTNGTIKTIKGKVCNVNSKDQILSLRDENQQACYIKLSAIRHIY
jgi:hypothetical protein